MLLSDRNASWVPGQLGNGERVTSEAVVFGDLAFRTLAPSVFSSAVSVFEVDLGPGCLSGPLHVHDKEDAISYVLDGELTFQVGEEITTARAGEIVLMPRGVQHTFWNAHVTRARALDIVTPGGLENYYEVVAGIADDADPPALLAAVERQFGIHMDWDSIAVLSERYGLRLTAL